MTPSLIYTTKGFHWIKGFCHNLYIFATCILRKSVVYMCCKVTDVFYVNQGCFKPAVVHVYPSGPPSCTNSFQRSWTCSGPACWGTTKRTGGECTRLVPPTKYGSHYKWLFCIFHLLFKFLKLPPTWGCARCPLLSFEARGFELTSANRCDVLQQEPMIMEVLKWQLAQLATASKLVKGRIHE